MSMADVVVADKQPTATRALRLHNAASQRVKGLICVLDRLEDRGNRAAILRTCEALGILHIHEVDHRDGRKTFPIAFILFLPSHVPVHKKVLYTRPVSDLCAKFAVNKHITLEDPEDLDVEWLEKQLQVKK